MATVDSWWTRLSPTAKRNLAVGSIGTVLLAVIIALATVTPEVSKPLSKQATIQHILTDSDPRSLGIDGISSQLRDLLQKNEEQARRLAAIEEQQKREQQSDEIRFKQWTSAERDAYEARLQAVTGHGRLELNDLLGQYMLVDGGAMKWIDGPLTLAVRLGHVLLINEIDAIDPAELIGLNEIVEGKPLTIPQTGDVITPHPKFRLVATGNSAGSGDQSGLYQGVLRQNLAFLDRFRLMEVGYPEPEDEMKLLADVVPTMPESVRESMIKVANQIRKVFIGGADGGGMLSVTLSTRGLVRWASLVATFKSAPNALAYSLDRALTFRAEPAEREAIHRIAKDVFGDDWQV